MPLRTCSPMSGATLHPSDPFDREHEPIVGDKRLERLIDRLPRFLRSSVRWLRQPSLIWLRIPAGVLLIAGGLLSFLPLLGLWMLPLGAILLSDDGIVPCAIASAASRPAAVRLSASSHVIGHQDISSSLGTPFRYTYRSGWRSAWESMNESAVPSSSSA